MSSKGWTLPVLGTAAALMLTACASQIMKSYVGAPISSIMLDYGPPDNVIEQGPRQRAYQWRREESRVVAGSSTEEFHRTRRGGRVEVSQTPGYVEHTECFYTFYASASGGDWYVTSFRRPQLDCE